MPNACGQMLVAACSHVPPRKTAFISNIVQHGSEAHAMHATAKRASTWGIGAEVCVRTGHRRPSVHVQGHRRPSVHVQWNTAETLKPESSKPQNFDPKP